MRPMKIPLLPSLRPAPQAAVWEESFDVLDPERWRHVKIHGATQYRIVEIDGRRCLRAESQENASLLLAPVSIDPRRSPWISWSWRVDQLVDGEALDRTSGSDAAARLYVYFDTPGLPWQKRNLDYVWSAVLPIGTSMRSPFGSHLNLIVVERGTESLGRWQRVERDVVEGYRRSFGEEPPKKIIAIGLMSDSDNTGSRAVAYFDDLRIGPSPLHLPTHADPLAEARPSTTQE